MCNTGDWYAHSYMYLSFQHSVCLLQLAASRCGVIMKIWREVVWQILIWQLLNRTCLGTGSSSYVYGSYSSQLKGRIVVCQSTHLLNNNEAIWIVAMTLLNASCNQRQFSNGIKPFTNRVKKQFAH